MNISTWEIKTTFFATYHLLILTDEIIEDFNDFLLKIERVKEAFLINKLSHSKQLGDENTRISFEILLEKKDRNHLRFLRDDKMIISGEEILSFKRLNL